MVEQMVAHLAWTRAVNSVEMMVAKMVYSKVEPLEQMKAVY